MSDINWNDLDSLTPADIEQMPVWMFNEWVKAGKLLSSKQAQEYLDIGSPESLKYAYTSSKTKLKVVKVGAGGGGSHGLTFFLKHWLDDYDAATKIGRPSKKRAYVKRSE